MRLPPAASLDSDTAASADEATIDEETARAVRAALRGLTGPRAGVPLRALAALGAGATVPLSLDLASARRIGVPVVVLREAGAAPSLDTHKEILGTLTAREREVALLVARGWTNRQIADDLCVTVATVKDHVHRCLAKTGLATRARLAVALSQGRT